MKQIYRLPLAMLCIVLTHCALSSSYAAEGDTIPLSGKTKESKQNPDVLDMKDQPAPMVPMVPEPKKGKKGETAKDTLQLKTGKKGEPEQAPVDPIQQATAYIGSIDVYGTDRVTEVDLKELFGKNLDQWVDMGMAGDPKAIEIQSQLAEKAKSKWDFAFADWSLAQYFTANGLAVHLTLDVVEKKDVNTRMAFLKDPTETLPDPDGLLAQWRKYEEIALELVETGQLVPDSERCVAFHCPFGHRHAKLKPFEKIFVDGAKKNSKQLFAILKNDKRADMRSAAAFVIPYTKDGKEIVAAMVERVPDPDVVVRNNVLRVLGDIAEFHSEITVPLTPVLKALSYPRVSDRSKALVVVFQLAEHSVAAREVIRKTSVPDLLQMLASKQPDHRELSYGILRKISGRDFPLDDEKSWKRWYRSVAKDNSITKQ